MRERERVCVCVKNKEEESFLKKKCFNLYLLVICTRTLLHKKAEEANVKIGTKGRALLEKMKPMTEKCSRNFFKKRKDFVACI